MIGTNHTKGLLLTPASKQNKKTRFIYIFAHKLSIIYQNYKKTILKILHGILLARCFAQKRWHLFTNANKTSGVFLESNIQEPLPTSWGIQVSLATGGCITSNMVDNSQGHLHDVSCEKCSQKNILLQLKSSFSFSCS